MAPKKTAGSASEKPTSSRPIVNGVSKSRSVKKDPAKAVNKTAVKAPAKRVTKAAAAKEPAKAPAKLSTDPTSNITTSKGATKSADGSDIAANTSKKRKAAHEEEEEKHDDPQVNGVKRQRASSEAVTTKPKVAAKTKASVEKKIKKKTLINNASPSRLDFFVFGEGASGELGLGSAKGQTEVKRPRLNPLLAAEKVGVVDFAVGGMHTAVLTHDNKILTWGVNDQGALGRDTTWEGGLRDVDDDKSESDSDSGSDTGVNPKESTPGEVDMTGVPEDVVWVKLECTDSATFALTDDGVVYGWGTFRSNEGIFGFNPSTLIQKTPILVEGVKNVIQLAGGENHMLALTKKGEVFAWGSGQQNQLGRRILERTKLNSLKPTQFGLPKQMTMVGAGSFHSFAVHKNGKVYAWGLNSFGETGIAKEIGDGGESDVHHATIIDSLTKFGKVISIDGGAHHTVAVTDKGELLVWGRVDGYQTGLPLSALPENEIVRDSANNPRILKVPTKIPGINAVQAAAGSDHCVAVAQDGKAYAWGFSATYQTGLGTDDDVEVATHIDNTATRGKKLVRAGCGGQFSVLAGIAGATSMVNGVH